MSRYNRDATLDCKIYVGDLARDATEKDLERAFSHYGPLRSVWVARNPPGFAFVEYEDHRDADDAVRALDGANVCGSRVRVEHSTGKIRPKPWNRRGGPPRGGGRYGDRGSRGNDRCYECGEAGHFAYDCPRGRRGGGGGGGGSSRKRSRSRSRSYDRSKRSYSRSRSRSNDRDRKRSVSRTPPRKYSKSRSRSNTPRNGAD